jgi:aryl-alcohol dehydrogenase-like predicted oxidoreductase
MIGSGLDAAAAEAVVDAALDAGISFFDTAESYAGGVSEELLGGALRGRRERAVIATKFGSLGDPDDAPDGSPAYIRAAVDRSLRRLGTDYIDILYYHRPDGVTPISETLAGLDEVVKSGKARFVGCSNFSGDQLREADETARANGTVRFIAVQNQYNLINRGVEDDVLPVCRELSIGLVPYFPLASGILTGKYKRGAPAPEGSRLSLGILGGPEDIDFDLVEALTEFSRERHHTLLELAIAAVASTPGVSGVIAGATSPDQVKANAAAASWTLNEAELAAIPR